MILVSAGYVIFCTLACYFQARLGLSGTTMFPHLAHTQSSRSAEGPHTMRVWALGGRLFLDWDSSCVISAPVNSFQ